MKIETDKITFKRGDDNILYIECLPKTIMTIDEGYLSTEKASELIQGEPIPMLCDLTNVVKMSQDCRKHFSGPEHAKVFSKCALLITSPISRIIGNFFLGANKPLKPTRLFTSKNDAIKWLKQ